MGLPAFAEKGVKVVGVRNQAGAKGSIREEIGIEKDLFGILGGRETYVVAADGTVTSVFNSQFDPDAHVKTAKEAVEALPKSPLDELKAKVSEFAGSLGVEL